MNKSWAHFVLLMLFSVSANAITLKIATVSPDGTTWMKEMRKGAEEIKQRTAERVKFRFYPGGVMGSDKNVLRKIRLGQLHGGAITGGGLEQIDFNSQIYSLPFAFRSHEEVDYVREKMDTKITEALYQKGFVSFGLAEGGFAYLMSNKPIRSSEDLKGQKVWIPEGDSMSQLAFEAAGVSPVALPLPDVLTGLQTGLIDTIGGSPIGAIALQWHTRVKYMTDTPLMYLYGILIVNRKSFERIAKEDRAVVKEVMGRVFKKLNEINRKENEQARQVLAEQGIQFVQQSETDRDHWDNIMVSTISEGKGDRFFSQKIFDSLQNNLNAIRSQ